MCKDYAKQGEEYNTTYDDDFLYLAKPFDGIIEMLKSLRGWE